MARAGNNPKRRIAAKGDLNATDLKDLKTAAKYVGSAHHKRSAGDYGFEPPANPRAWKSLCDKNRTILMDEAEALIQAGLAKEMFSTHFIGELPKYIWAVDDAGIPYEAKLGEGGYHGYPLEEDDNMRDIVLSTWKKR